MTVAEAELQKEAVKPTKSVLPKLTVGQTFNGNEYNWTYVGKDRSGAHWFLTQGDNFECTTELYTKADLLKKLRQEIIEADSDKVSDWLYKYVGENEINSKWDDEQTAMFEQNWKEVEWKTLTPGEKARALEDTEWNEEDMTDFDTVWADLEGDHYAVNEEKAQAFVFEDYDSFTWWWEDVTGVNDKGAIQYNKEWLNDIMEGILGDEDLGEYISGGDYYNISEGELWMYPQMDFRSLSEVMDTEWADQFAKYILPNVYKVNPDLKAIIDDVNDILRLGNGYNETRKILSEKYGTGEYWSTVGYMIEAFFEGMDKTSSQFNAGNYSISTNNLIQYTKDTSDETIANKEAGMIREAETLYGMIKKTLDNERGYRGAKWRTEFYENDEGEKIFKLVHHGTSVIIANLTKKTADLSRAWWTVSDKGGMSGAMSLIGAGGWDSLGYLPAHGWKDSNPERQKKLEIRDQIRDELDYVVGEGMNLSRLREYIFDKYDALVGDDAVKVETENLWRMMKNRYFRTLEKEVAKKYDPEKKKELVNEMLNKYRMVGLRKPDILHAIDSRHNAKVSDLAEKIKGSVLKQLIDTIAVGGMSLQEAIDEIASQYKSNLEQEAVRNAIANQMSEDDKINVVKDIINQYLLMGMEFGEVMQGVFDLRSLYGEDGKTTQEELIREMVESEERDWGDGTLKGLLKLLKQYYPKEMGEMIAKLSSEDSEND